MIRTANSKSPRSKLVRNRNPSPIPDQCFRNAGETADAIGEEGCGIADAKLPAGREQDTTSGEQRSRRADGSERQPRQRKTHTDGGQAVEKKEWCDRKDCPQREEDEGRAGGG